MKEKKRMGFWKQVEISGRIAKMYGHRARVAAVRAGKIGERLPTTAELIMGKQPKKAAKRRK